MWAELAKRSLLSWFFEVLPVALLALQSAVAVLSHGDVDGRARGLVSGSGTADGKHAHGGKMSKLLGAWRVQEWHGMEEFLEQLSFPKWQRALAARAGQSYVLQLKGGSTNDSLDKATLRIETRDMRGTSALELPLDGQAVKSRDGDGGAEVMRAARLNGQDLEITETFARESRPYSVCKRTVTDDGRMLLEVKKRTACGRWVGMRAFARRVVDQACNA